VEAIGSSKLFQRTGTIFGEFQFNGAKRAEAILQPISATTNRDCLSPTLYFAGKVGCFIWLAMAGSKCGVNEAFGDEAD